MSSPSDLSERRPLLHRNPNRRTSRSTVYATPPPASPAVLGERRARRRTRAASVFILLCLVFERIAFYGLAGNLVLFLNKDPFKWDSYYAVTASLFFFGVCFVTSLVGGWLADSIFGRFKAILFSFVIYISGYILMPFLSTKSGMIHGSKPETRNVSLPSVCKWVRSHDDNGTDNDTDPFDEPCAWLIYIVLTIIAIGTGFVKASIAPFGSDQVAREGQQVTLSFFNWFYWSVNIGALIGLGVITYVQQQHNFFFGYLTAAICLGVALVLFVLGRFFYTVRSPDGSVLTNIFRIIREAWRRKRQRRYAIRATGGTSDRVDEAEPAEAQISFLDYAKHRHGGVFHDALVNDVKELKKIICVFAVLIPYWVVYFQMQTTFLLQGLHMRLMYTHKSGSVHNLSAILQNATSTTDHPKIVAAWFSIFDVMVLIILLPLFDRIVYPRLERRGYPVSISHRILTGMVFAMLAMVIAGVVEYKRLEAFWPSHDQPCLNHSINQSIGGSVFYAADMSVLWQIPQYVLIGISEVFTSVAGLQFAVSVAPASMKGIIMGLFYLFSGIGSFLGTAIITILTVTNTWFHSLDYGNINCRGCNGTDDKHPSYFCHLDYYFYLLAGIELFGALMFMLVARKFQLDRHLRDSRARTPLVDASGEFLDPSSARRPSGALPHSIQRNVSEDLSS
ncbi:hypothetical protein BaRGS_00034326 [Batillaria attramentaria]|uniref:Solute carrier family 15 member 4 n=1 Tax=Batillaria attramentaria TaxID=370345 RepID=A0ABD0JHL6_9CAEN